ncbi:Ig-like domain-containing protein [Archaeoglobus neptunius]|uniref:Ig-like domain-containing protein n=1 Tax=Archaeoglobus neptunius TaxID=2798580 RepID=UPI0019258624|nr:Ig-like domain-containing protein [Archaeoglobus neptunius]
MKKALLPVLVTMAAFMLLLTNVSAVDTGTDIDDAGLTEVTMGSIVPVVTESGKISLSIDGLGIYPASSGIIQVEKPNGATVRAAYLAAATTGFTRYKLSDGDVAIDGVGVSWDIETPSSISSWNYWANVTSIVKSKIDSAPAGRIDFNISEANTYRIDGVILAVIFDDPNQVTDNTVILLFGAQDVNGDTFAVLFAEPIDKSDPNLVLDMSLGISYGYQDSSDYTQYSNVDVNGVRLTSSAGGHDDGQAHNGALLTVGGLDDSNANPADAYSHGDATSPRYDDELYSLIPLVADGDTTITVYTDNPSNDDNIFFAAFFLSTSAVVGEGIVLSPVSATNALNTQHTVTATVQDDHGQPIAGRNVTFTIVSGPNAGLTDIAVTDINGQASFTYTSTSAGTDVIVASMVNSQGVTVQSNQVEKTWEGAPSVPEFPPVAVGALGMLAAIVLLRARRE